MSVGGGLYDHPDPEPDRARFQAPSRRIHGSAYEILYGGMFLIGVWAAFQGWPKVAFLGLLPAMLVIGTIAAVVSARMEP